MSESATKSTNGAGAGAGAGSGGATTPYTPDTRIRPARIPPSASSTLDTPREITSPSSSPSPSPSPSIRTERIKATWSRGRSPSVGANASPIARTRSIHITPRTTFSPRSQHDSKRSRIQSTFLNISSMLIVLCLALLVWYDYVMLAPHLSAIFWAALWSIFLSKPHQVLLSLLTWLDVRLAPYLTRIYLCGLCIYIAIVVMSPLAGILVATLAFLLFTCILYAERTMLAAATLVLFVILILAFPLFFFLKTCVEESQQIALRVTAFVESSPELQAILEDL